MNTMEILGVLSIGKLFRRKKGENSSTLILLSREIYTYPG